jgi:uncharacterized protein YlxW (UPF0749 family)
MSDAHATQEPAEETASSLLRQLSFEPKRPHFAIGLLFLVLGLLITVAVIRPDGANPWQSARTEDLVQILDGLDSRQERLAAESSRLSALQADLEKGSTAQALEESRRKVGALQVLAGTTAVTGPGLTITITDPSGAVDSPVLIDAVQELRDAGAEAIQVGDSRVVVDTWFADRGQGLVVDGTPVLTPIRIVAIGDPDTLKGAVGIPGGLADTVGARGADFATTTAQSLTISVTVPSTAD